VVRVKQRAPPVVRVAAVVVSTLVLPAVLRQVRMVRFFRRHRWLAAIVMFAARPLHR
jgi:hypothetical protein